VKTVQVVKVPAGEAPEWVRESWVGCVFRAEGPVDTKGRNILTGSGPVLGSFYRVDWDEAVGALDAHGQHDAAEWWRFVPPQLPFLLFQAEECEETTPDSLLIASKNSSIV